MDRPESTEGGPGTEPGRHRADRHPSPQMTLLLLRNTHWLTRGLEGLRPERWCHPLRLTWWGGGGATVSSDASISSVPAPNPGPLLCLAWLPPARFGGLQPWSGHTWLLTHTPPSTVQALQKVPPPPPGPLDLSLPERVRVPCLTADFSDPYWGRAGADAGPFLWGSCCHRLELIPEQPPWVPGRVWAQVGLTQAGES